jgi:hypothetical protein
MLAHQPRGRLRYEDPKIAKWRVFDSIELDGNNDDDEPAETAVVPEQLALFAASAAPPDLRAAIARRIGAAAGGRASRSGRRSTAPEFWMEQEVACGAPPTRGRLDLQP